MGRHLDRRVFNDDRLFRPDLRHNSVVLDKLLNELLSGVLYRLSILNSLQLVLDPQLLLEVLPLLRQRVRAFYNAHLVLAVDHLVQTADLLQVELPRPVQVLEVAELIVDAFDLGALLSEPLIVFGLLVLVPLRFDQLAVLLPLHLPLLG